MNCFLRQTAGSWLRQNIWVKIEKPLAPCTVVLERGCPWPFVEMFTHIFCLSPETAVCSTEQFTPLASYFFDLILTSENMKKKISSFEPILYPYFGRRPEPALYQKSNSHQWHPTSFMKYPGHPLSWTTVCCLYFYPHFLSQPKPAVCCLLQRAVHTSGILLLWLKVKYRKHEGNGC